MNWGNLLAYVVIALLGLAAPVGFVVHYWIIKSKQKRELDSMEESDTLPEPELVPAQVTERKIDRYYTGGRKSSVYHEDFLVTFQLEDGGVMTCAVPKETYYTLSEGDSGMLLHVNGHFLDFGEGKECDTTM